VSKFAFNQPELSEIGTVISELKKLKETISELKQADPAQNNALIIEQIQKNSNLSEADQKQMTSNLEAASIQVKLGQLGEKVE